jgi:hypothetical protein
VRPWVFIVATLALERRDSTNRERWLDFAESVPNSARGLSGAIVWVSPDEAWWSRGEPPPR